MVMKTSSNSMISLSHDFPTINATHTCIQKKTEEQGDNKDDPLLSLSEVKLAQQRLHEEENHLSNSPKIVELKEIDLYPYWWYPAFIRRNPLLRTVTGCLWLVFKMLWKPLVLGLAIICPILLEYFSIAMLIVTSTLIGCIFLMFIIAYFYKLYYSSQKKINHNLEI